MKPFHEMTRQEAHDYLLALYFAQPKADWDTLAVGNVIVNKGRAWRITHIPPKRGFVMATNLMTGKAEKLLRSKYDNDDLHCDGRGHVCHPANRSQGGNREGNGLGHHHQPGSPIRLSRTFHAISCVVG